MLHAPICIECYDATMVIAAFAARHPPFRVEPQTTVCIRLNHVLPEHMDRFCLHRRLHVLALERRRFSDGEATVYLVQPT